MICRVLEFSDVCSTLVASDGSFIWVNRALSDLLGLTPEQLMGSRWQDLTHPDDLEVDQQLVTEVLNGTRQSYRLRKRYLHADRSYVWGDLTVSCVHTPEGSFDCFLSQIVNVTDLVKANERLAESEERFRLLAENSTDVVILSSEGVMRWVSPSLVNELGWNPVDWIEHPFDEFTHPEDLSTVHEWRGLIAGGKPFVDRIRALDHQGSFHWVEIHAGPYRDSGGEQVGVVSSLRTIDDTVKAEQERERLAQFDILTGLMNRREILGRVTNMINRTPRTGTRTAVLFCDIDKFKEVNDEFGHAAGDQVLRMLGERVASCIRSDDYAARIGGDELLVALAGVHRIDEAFAIAEKIRVAGAEPIVLQSGNTVNLSMSIGVALSRPGENVDELIGRADAAMYRAKESGRNRVLATA